MTMQILNATAALLYIVAGGLLIRQLFSGKSGTTNKLPVLILSAVAVILHAIILYLDLAPHPEWSLGLTNAFSIVAFAVAAAFTVIAITRPIENLGAVVMPTAAAAIIAAWFWPVGSEGSVEPSRPLTAHLIVSILAYAFLSLAVVQALLLSAQERRLRQRDPGRLLNALPPIQTMEGLLFVLTGIGFALLTLTLVSGAIYTKSLLGVTLTFNHHTVLSILAWLIFGILLIGHFRFGWRGRHAAHWTIGGFIVLVLGYFGTKYVVEVLLL
ncbi:MAG: cytochrome c biogenesis protein CcsA [Arenicellales bacterium]|nr:cytochrome c biogenesis protein CcsA [Arenicellales bacterium]